MPIVTLEGIDGTGKTTQMKRLVGALIESDVNVHFYKYPKKTDDSPIYAHLRGKKKYTPKELAGFYLDEMKNELPLIWEESKDGIVVLSRYFYSTIAYQGAKGIDKEMIKKANEEFVVKPDLVFILDIDAKRGLERIQDRKKKDKLFEREDYLVKVRKIFRSFKGENIIHIDALKPKEEISKETEG